MSAGHWSQHLMPPLISATKRPQQAIKAFQDSRQDARIPKWPWCTRLLKGQGFLQQHVYMKNKQTNLRRGWLLSTNASWERLVSTSQRDWKCCSRNTVEKGLKITLASKFSAGVFSVWNANHDTFSAAAKYSETHWARDSFSYKYLLQRRYLLCTCYHNITQYKSTKYSHILML